VLFRASCAKYGGNQSDSDCVQPSKTARYFHEDISLIVCLLCSFFTITVNVLFIIVKINKKRKYEIKIPALFNLDNFVVPESQFHIYSAFPAAIFTT